MSSPPPGPAPRPTRVTGARPAVWLIPPTLAVLFFAGSAAGEGEAGESFRAAIPERWREAPALLPAEGDREEDRARLIARRAWADPSAGVYALIQVVDVSGGAEPEAVARTVSAALAAAGQGGRIAGRDEGPGRSHRIQISSERLRGELWLLSVETGRDALRTGTAACFYNQREPTVSKRVCKEMLESFEVLP